MIRHGCYSSKLHRLAARRGGESSCSCLQNLHALLPGRSVTLQVLGLDQRQDMWRFALRSDAKVPEMSANACFLSFECVASLALGAGMVQGVPVMAFNDCKANWIQQPLMRPQDVIHPVFSVSRNGTLSFSTES